MQFKRIVVNNDEMMIGKNLYPKCLSTVINIKYSCVMSKLRCKPDQIIPDESPDLNSTLL